jgi:hypothetical protein
MTDDNLCVSNNKELKYKIDVDVNSALVGLKALTRETKKATSALKELKEQHEKMSNSEDEAE